MERKLLLLGLLRGEEMHGYQLNEFIDSHYGVIVNLKQPTAYRLLQKMADDGWVTFREERDGNRPPRRVFAITPDGEAAFKRLLRESVADFKPSVYSGNIGLLFLHAVPPIEAARLLRQRRAGVDRVLQQVRAHNAHDENAVLIISNQTRHLTTEIDWLDTVIAQLESSPAQNLTAAGKTA